MRARGLRLLFPLAALAVVGTAWALRGRIGRGPVAGLLYFAGTLFPVLGFVNVYPFKFSFVADHFKYLASCRSRFTYLLLLPTRGGLIHRPHFASN